MNKIKFSHEYNKFFGINSGARVKLLEVFIADRKELSSDFINYDARTSKGTYYKIPDGKLIILFFYSNETNSAFTTIRRWEQGKENYYRTKIGTSFELVIG